MKDAGPFQEENEGVAGEGESREAHNTAAPLLDAEERLAANESDTELINTRCDASPSNITNAMATSPTRNVVVYDRLKQLRSLADKAMQDGHVFTVLGPYPSIRQSLRRRGWVEKMYDSIHVARYRRRMMNRAIERATYGKPSSGTESDAQDSSDQDDEGFDPSKIDTLMAVSDSTIMDSFTILSRMVRYSPSYFIWTRRRDHINFKHLQKDQLVNHFPNSDFTTKLGLCALLQDIYWYTSYDVRTFFPRCYRFGLEDEREAFIEDFRLTTCLSILKWVVHQVQSSHVYHPANAETLRIPLRAVELALQHCDSYIRSRNHEDIDSELNGNLNDSQWAVMLEWYYQLAHQGAFMPRAVTLYEQCHKMLHRMRRHWPQMDLDGMNNVWIVKPGAKSRGMGIMILERLEDILKLVEAQVFMKATKYVVQKYIERPLLIYNTKFDIRQWFLITDWNPLTLYFYKECYLRFCSRPFTLRDKSEAIHLCNNSIQRNYIRRDGPRSILPEEYMWTSDEFREHLRLRGKGLTWENIVYPRMKKAVIATLVAAQDGAEVRKGCFELYGADFMLTEDFHPWLIEINSSPCMAPTTKVTGKMCTQVLEDSIKVLVDRRENRNCCLGSFELAYRHSTVSVPPYIGISLGIQGVGLMRPGGQDGTKEDVAGEDMYRRSEIHPKETRSSPGARPTNKENTVVRRRMSKAIRTSPRDSSPKNSRNITLSPKEKTYKRSTASTPVLAPGGHGEPQLHGDANHNIPALCRKFKMVSELTQDNNSDSSAMPCRMQKVGGSQQALLEIHQPHERQKAGCQFSHKLDKDFKRGSCTPSYVKWMNAQNLLRPTPTRTGFMHHGAGAKLVMDPYFANRSNTVNSERVPICPSSFYSQQLPQPESWSQLPPALKTYLRSSSLLRTCHTPTDPNCHGASVWQQVQNSQQPFPHRTPSERTSLQHRVVPMPY